MNVFFSAQLCCLSSLLTKVKRAIWYLVWQTWRNGLIEGKISLLQSLATRSTTEHKLTCNGRCHVHIKGIHLRLRGSTSVSSVVSATWTLSLPWVLTQWVLGTAMAFCIQFVVEYSLALVTYTFFRHASRLPSLSVPLTSEMANVYLLHFPGTEDCSNCEVGP